jgi:hypothetical protein
VACECADDAVHDVAYLRGGCRRGEQESQQQAQDCLPGAQAHISPGKPHERAEHHDERNRNSHLITSSRNSRQCLSVVARAGAKSYGAASGYGFGTSGKVANRFQLSRRIRSVGHRRWQEECALSDSPPRVVVFRGFGFAARAVGIDAKQAAGECVDAPMAWLSKCVPPLCGVDAEHHDHECQKRSQCGASGDNSEDSHGDHFPS